LAAAVVRKARGRAAVVLRIARARADQEMRREGASAAERKVVATARSGADALLRREYAVADAALLLGERKSRRHGGALGQMRGKTDRSLSAERADADSLLARRDEFLGLVSHDLRNELTAVSLGVVRIINTAAEGDVDRVIFRVAANVHRVTLRMSRLVDDLVDLVSIDADRFIVIPERQDAARLVSEIVETFGPLAVEKDVSLAVSGRPGPTNGRFDRHRILQALANLVLNAIKFTPAGGHVDVGVAAARNRIHFSVSDTGPGIARDQLEAIFERYAQGAQNRHQGLGLGLYIARHIVEAHQGAIWAESAIGRGSTFHISLPITTDLPRPARRARRGRAHAELRMARA
jgi:signal transduction histidine kinase